MQMINYFKNGVKYAIVSLALSLICGCQSGSSGASSSIDPIPPSPIDPIPPSPESGALGSYVNLLAYSPTTKLLSENLTQAQQSITLKYVLPITQIKINFYSDAKCANLSTTVLFNGYVTLLAGRYTTTTDSNLSACSLFNQSGNTGCVYAYNSNSLNFVVTSESGDVINGSCMTNPTWSGERIGYYNLESNWARNCSLLSNCGYSQDYTMQLN